MHQIVRGSSQNESSALEGLEWDLGFCIYNKFPSDAKAEREMSESLLESF